MQCMKASWGRITPNKHYIIPITLILRSMNKTNLAISILNKPITSKEILPDIVHISLKGVGLRSKLHMLHFQAKFPHGSRGQTTNYNKERCLGPSYFLTTRDGN